MLENNWAKIVPEEVLYLISHLNRHGFEAWLVGGCVRDMFLGIMPDDYDVATSALPEEVIGLFDRCLETGVKHGTVTVILAGQTYEVTTYRSEGPYTDGRRPDQVSYEREIILDLARRDFTVNSMAWHPSHGLLDPFAGRKHLEARKLRCVGNAETRLTEDALRQLRAIRFALTYNLHPDNEMLEAIKRHNSKIDNLSAERIQIELTRTGRAPYGSMLADFNGTGLVSRVYARILNITAKDDLLCKILAGFIQPFWEKEQIWTVLFLAGLIARSTDMVPDQEYGCFSLKLSYWGKIAAFLVPGRIRGLTTMLVEKTRLSLLLARITQANLMLIGLRLMLWAADRRSGRQEKAKELTDSKRRLRLQLILRTAARQNRLDQWQALDACEYAWDILSVLVDNEDFQRDLSADREMLLRWRSFPDEYRLSPVQLSIRGNDDVFLQLKDKRKIGVYLDRLLSMQLHTGSSITQDEARSILKTWIEIDAKK